MSGTSPGSAKTSKVVKRLQALSRAVKGRTAKLRAYAGERGDRKALRSPMRRRFCRPSKRTLAFLAAIVLTVTIFAAPWWWPWLLWRKSTTSFVTAVPGYDSVTFLPKAEFSASNAGELLIPAIMHQTWKDENIPPEWQEAQQACKDLHPGWEYKLWTDNSSEAFIADRFPALLRTFQRYPYNIERADVIRYAVLAEYGGFYIDLDIQCRRPLDFLRRYPLVLPATRPVGFSNDFLAAAPRHPLMLQMLQALPAWSVPLITKYPTVMFSTGPMFVTLQASSYRNRSELWVLPDGMYGKYTHTANPIFVHLFGSSWHGSDARSILWFVKHPAFLASFGAFLSLAVGSSLWLAWRKRKRRQAGQAKMMELVVDTVKSA